MSQPLSNDILLTFFSFLKGVTVSGLEASYSTRTLTAGAKDDVSINAVASFTEGSIDLRGSGLWGLAMYGSQNEDGSGDQFQRVEQTLSSSQQGQALSGGQPITFSNAKGQIDVVAIGCNEYGYICFDFIQGENPNPDYTFRTLQEPDTSKYTTCQPKECEAGEYFFLINVYILDNSLISGTSF